MIEWQRLWKNTSKINADILLLAMLKKYLNDISLSSDIFFSIEVFFHDHSWITGLLGKGEGIPLTPHYQLHPLYRYLDISQAITAESSLLHMGSSRTRTGDFWFPSTSC